MKLFVSTKETQGQRRNDYSWVDEGEVVSFGFECDREAVDGECGCKRALIGVISLKATTTFKVIDSELTVEGLAECISASLVAGGWTFDSDGRASTKNAQELSRLAAMFPVGAIVEKRGTRLVERRPTA